MTRLDWHAFNVAAAAFLAEAHKRAQDDAERKAKRKSGNTRGPRSRSTSRSHDDGDGSLTSDPIASATYTTLTLPDTMFG